MFSYLVPMIVIFWFFNNVKATNVADNRIAKHYDMGEIECPYPYQKVAGMCLFTSGCGNQYNFTAARTFCQSMKGGDLVFFRDSNEFYDIIGYLQLVEPGRTCNFWLGATFIKTSSSSPTVGIWQWLQPNVAPLSPTDISWALQQPDNLLTHQYLFLSNTDYYRVADGVQTELYTAALCRLIPKRRKKDDILWFQISYPSSQEII